MPRPDLISKIHEIKYELRRSGISDKEYLRLMDEYESLLKEACSFYKCEKPALLQAIAKDFGLWIRDSNLPWPLRDD